MQGRRAEATGRPRPSFGRRVFAVVIGIDEYTNIRGVNLRGAAADAAAFGQFLQISFAEPTITYLYNKEATRSNILVALTSLSTDRRIQNNDAIVIYFAGHGTRCSKPDSPDWIHWSSPHSKIELLCPSDIQDPKHADGRNVICGIPDRTIAALLDKIANKKGNNITIILDCCHSAGATREAGSDSLIKRFLDADAPFFIPADCDNSIWSQQEESERGVIVPAKDVGRGLDSRVLLAACRSDEGAFEDQHMGLFTRALLALMYNVGTQGMDYATLIRKVDLSKDLRGRKQNPSCDGVNINRLPFSRYTKTGSVPLISGQTDNDGTIILNAGQAQGIWKDAPISIHATSNLSPEANPPLLALHVSKVMAVKSVLSSKQSNRASHIPKQFYARLIEYQTGTSFYAYCEAKLPDLSAIGISSSQTKENADMIVALEGHRLFYTMRFRVADLIILGVHLQFGIGEATNEYHSFRLNSSTAADNIDDMIKVLRAALRFKTYLTLSSSRNNLKAGMIPMEFVQVQQFSTSYGDQIYKSVGQNLIAHGVATLTITGPKNQCFTYDNREFGVTLQNKTKFELHPYLIIFDIFSLAIEPLYLPPEGNADGRHVEATLQPHSIFAIGYNDSTVVPRSFALPDTTHVDISFFKLFVATEHSDFSFLKQESPFAGARVSYAKNVAPPSLWGTSMFAVVQQSERYAQEHGKVDLSRT